MFVLHNVNKSGNDISLLLSIFLLFLLQTTRGNEISLLSASAELSPDTLALHFTNPPRQASASVAIDGDNRKGRAGGLLEDILKCAATSMETKSRNNPLKYLLIKMKSAEYISYVRLHLRDGLKRQKLQNGLTVSVGNSSDIQRASSCGNEAYNAVRHGQSPFFICMNSAQYIWIVLRNSVWPLQVCEVRAYSGYMNLTAPGIASLSHGPYQQVSFASNAVDGNSAIGNSGGDGFLKCAVNDISKSKKDQLQFLRISFGHEKEVLFIRLHLRDERRRYSQQQGLLVGVSSSHHVHDSQKQCGSAYDESQGQSPTFICNATGSYVWLTLTSPHYLQVCEVEVYAVVRCVSLSHPANGQYRITSDSVGGFLSVNCNQGYAPTSPNHAICQSIGNWSQPIPTCEIEIQCPDISKEAINNGRILNTNRLFGSLAVYECNAGYRVVGNRTRTCQQNGTWSGNPPVCQGSKCDTLISPNNGNVTIKILQSVAIATYSCNAGYTLKVGGITRVCLPNGVWSGNQPSCKQTQCPDISKEAITNGRIVSNNRLFGSLAVYECNDGYRIVGNRTRTCRQDGTWSDDPPICQGSKCDTPRAPSNGNVTTETLQSVVIATYSCNAGYTLKDGGITRVCFPNGVWGGNQPLCKPCSCDSPQSRRDANKKRHAVVLLQITSSAQEIQEEISYKAKIKKICRANNAVARKIKAGHFASLAVTQRTQDGTCRCPNFQRKVVYAVGVNVNSKSGKYWKLEVPRNFYVAKSKLC